MLRVALFGVLGFMAGWSVMAQQATTELLSSPRVEGYMLLRVTPTADQKGFVIEYQVDNDDPKSFKPWNSEHTVVGTQSFNVQILNYNPLTMAAALSITEEDDPNYGAVSGFWEALSAFLGTLGVKTPTAEEAARAADARVPKVPNSATLLEWMLFIQTFQTNCNPADQRSISKVNGVLEKADEVIFSKPDTSALRNLTHNAASYDTQTKLKVAADMLLRVHQALVPNTQPPPREGPSIVAAEYQLSKVAGLSPEFPSCPLVQAYTVGRIGEFMREAKEVISRKKKLAANVEELKKRIDATTAQYVEDNVYQLDSVKADASKIRIVTVTVKPIEAKVSDTGIELASTDGTSVTMRVRKYRTAATEFGAGILVTHITAQKYGTADINGQTVVATAGDDEQNAVVAALLNVVFRNRGGGIFPMVQVGVGTGKERPTLAVGGGLRFGKPRHLAVSIGAVVAWRRELDELQPGDVVDGTASIEEDLKLKPVVRAYFGIQYNF